MELENAKEEIVLFKESLQTKEKIVMNLLNKEKIEPELVDTGQPKSGTTNLLQENTSNIDTNMNKELEQLKVWYYRY